MKNSVVLFGIVVIVVALFLTTTSTSTVFSFPLQQEAFSSENFYADWMGHLLPLISNYSFLSLSIPGTHDTMTYTLSTTIADNANDIPPWLSWILHEFTPLINMLDIGRWVRQQARTQGLNITQQLDNGIRFVDFRVDYTAGTHSPSTSKNYSWRILHMLESLDLAINYLKEIRTWVSEHPTEVIVIYISHHGSECGRHYHVSPEIQQTFWKQIENLFSGIMFDTSISNFNETTYGDLLSRGQRVVFYTASHTNFTDDSKFAIDACDFLDNSGSGDNTPKQSVEDGIRVFQQSAKRRESDSKQNRFYLSSMAGPTVVESLGLNAELAFLGPLHLINETEVNQKCTSLFKTPGLSNCFGCLQAKGLFANYYHQYSFHEAVDTMKKEYEYGNKKNSLSYSFPNAIYLDAVDVEGTIRTGAEPFWASGYQHDTICGTSDKYFTNLTQKERKSKFSYVASLLLGNAFWICSGGVIPPQNSRNKLSKPSKETCDSIIEKLLVLYNKNPKQLWNDPSNGRLVNYP